MSTCSALVRSPVTRRRGSGARFTRVGVVRIRSCSARSGSCRTVDDEQLVVTGQPFLRDSLEIRNRALGAYRLPRNEQRELELPDLCVLTHFEHSLRKADTATRIGSARPQRGVRSWRRRVARLHFSLDRGAVATRVRG